MKLQVIGFTIIVALAIFGVDLSMQAKASGQSIGQLGLSGYMDTITARYDAVLEERALKERQKQMAKIHLPEAPEGWTRREWEDGDNARLSPPTTLRTPSDKQTIDEMGGLIDLNEAKTARDQQREIWVYEKGSSIIALGAQYRKPKAGSGGISGRAMKMVLGNMEGLNRGEAYALVQGVAYGERFSMYPVKPEMEYRVISAKLGGDILLTVSAIAPDIEIRNLIKAINYDGLNAMLDHPDTNVGLMAQNVDPAQETAMAEAILEQQSDAVRNAGRVAEKELMQIGGAVSNANSVGEIAAIIDRSESDLVEQAPKITVGLTPVKGMPGRKCTHGSGNALCGLKSD